MHVRDACINNNIINLNTSYEKNVQLSSNKYLLYFIIIIRGYLHGKYNCLRLLSATILSHKQESTTTFSLCLRTSKLEV